MFAHLGKPDQQIMGNLITRFTGHRSSDVLLGPKPGVDVSVLRIDSRQVMIVSSDPISFIPSIGPEASARMSVFEVSSDVATSGNPPSYAVIDLNLPPHMSDNVLSRYWKSFSASCAEQSIAIVGGHTGRFQGCDYSIIGGATLWAICDRNRYVTSEMGGDGDDLIITKSAGYGATSVLTRAFPKTVRKTIGSVLFKKALEYFSHSNTVRDSLSAVEVGIHEDGVTAMHDATEGGVIAALLELAKASRVGGSIAVEDIPVSEETDQICNFFQIDPLTSLGEGSLVIACRPHRTDRLIARLRRERTAATVVGRLTSKRDGLRRANKAGSSSIRYPTVDPYWKAYWTAVRKGWN